jgi:small subunit ribosomal protein S29
MRACKEVSNSATKEGYVDLNLDAAAWLVHFKCQNAALLNKIDVSTMLITFMFSKLLLEEETA